MRDITNKKLMKILLEHGILEYVWAKLSQNDEEVFKALRRSQRKQKPRES